MKHLRIYILTLLVLLIIDGFWLLIVADEFYALSLLPLLREHEILWADILLYALYPFGITYFVTEHSIAKQSPKYAQKHGAIFGAVVYGYYNLTNQAMLHHWPTMVTIIDILWGTILTSLVSYMVTVFVLKTKLKLH